MRINTDQFSYHAVDGTFTACASTLGELFTGKDFELVSERTGKAIHMRLGRPHYDRERDLTHWDFTPVDCESFKSLIIFND